MAEDRWLRWQAEDGDLTGRQTITMRARGRVDQDQVRAARTGEAHIIAAGRVARARIIRTAIGDDVTTCAIELVPKSCPHSRLTRRNCPHESHQRRPPGIRSTWLR